MPNTNVKGAIIGSNGINASDSAVSATIGVENELFTCLIRIIGEVTGAMVVANGQFKTNSTSRYYHSGGALPIAF